MLHGRLLKSPAGLPKLIAGRVTNNIWHQYAGRRHNATTTHGNLKEIKFATPGNKYPASLNIFHAGVGLTSYIGMFKLGTIFYFAFNCLVRTPSLNLVDDTAIWWVPLSLAIYSVPMISTQLITAPFTNSVNVLIPQEARKDDQALQRWLAHPPGDTLVEFTSLRFLPLPKRKTVKLEDLRVLPPNKWYRIAQFEYIPPKLRESSRGSTLSWFKGWLGGRRTFYVREGSRYTTTTRGGRQVWPALVDVILRQSGDRQQPPTQSGDRQHPPTKSAPRPAARSDRVIRPASRRMPPGQRRTTPGQPR